MDDLISREAAIAYSISGMTREIDGDKWIRVSEVRESIKTMPSAQPEIIRCKDCTWFDSPRVCLRHGRFVENNNWFCADGERRRE